MIRDRQCSVCCQSGRPAGSVATLEEGDTPAWSNCIMHDNVSQAATELVLSKAYAWSVEHLIVHRGSHILQVIQTAVLQTTAVVGGWQNQECLHVR